MALGPWLTTDDKLAVCKVLDSGDLMSGKRVAQLEERLAEYFGKRWCVCVSSGTAALECAFVATGEGNTVHPEGFVAILSAARAAGRKPAWSRDSDNAVKTDVLGIARLATTRVHDCAHRFDKGAAHAEVSCGSFAPNKFIAACGGWLVTNDSVVASTARQYRNHGRDGGPECYREGRNLRMGEINAALALSQLTRIKEILDRRKQVAEWYDEELGQQFAPTVKSHFLYPFRYPSPDHGVRSMESFRLFNTATHGDRCTALFEIWPTMTRDEVRAWTTRANQCKS